ncbi:hypothetical protein M8C21_017160 [Ambrosia artemisiifolia]|uniref:Uncharacterized protein n=1 Tax=Ambrosia artemisiifolia TaxID=4212 RepID=A0AAD5GVF5_AMBAR|nr:hypothetical protein M8C21_017160 [Ambrosia artemisiifolia]
MVVVAERGLLQRVDDKGGGWWLMTKVMAEWICGDDDEDDGGRGVFAEGFDRGGGRLKMVLLWRQREIIDEMADVTCCESQFFLYLMVIVGLVAFAGLMAGLMLGLMSLGLVDLEVLSGRSGFEDVCKFEDPVRLCVHV